LPSLGSLGVLRVRRTSCTAFYARQSRHMPLESSRVSPSLFGRCGPPVQQFEFPYSGKSHGISGEGMARHFACRRLDD
jgi:hypothetical protein